MVYLDDSFDKKKDCCNHIEFLSKKIIMKSFAIKIFAWNF